jgi:hypothetical protein
MGRTVPILLIGGPLSGYTIDADRITELRLMVPTGSDEIYCYERDADGLEYYFNDAKTEWLCANYEAAMARFGPMLTLVELKGNDDARPGEIAG